MAGFSAIENFKPIIDQDKLDKAELYKRPFYKKYVRPVAIITGIEYDKNTNLHKVTKTEDISKLKDMKFAKGDKIILDFGDHWVGHLSYKIDYVGSPPDAAGFYHIKFCEIPDEIVFNPDDYDGWLSKSWYQQEWDHIWEFPKKITKETRYAFRYVQIEVIDTSAKYQLKFSDFVIEAESAIDFNNKPKLKHTTNERFKLLDKIGLKTLRDCMQDVYEDGPKRDHTLWVGDMRIEALTNYESFKDLDLIKRCLYLYAGSKMPNKGVTAKMYVQPEVKADDTYLVDYSLLYVNTVVDYYRETKDLELVKDLWQVVVDQIELNYSLLNKDHYNNNDNSQWWAFVDWNDDLDKNAAVQGIYIYTYKNALEIAKAVGDKDIVSKLEHYINETSEAGIKHYWDENQGLFVSGDKKQISYHSQIWMVLANVFDKAKNKEILQKLLKLNPEINLRTPYNYHYLLEALFENDLQKEAIEIMEYYWGKMVDLGADTYWELFNPEDLFFSPYGSSITINSFCHAWSVAPSYFIRKYLDK